MQKLLSDYLERREVTKQQVADAIGISRTAVSYLISGRADGQPYLGLRGDDPVFFKVCQFLRIPQKEAQEAARADYYARALEKSLGASSRARRASNRWFRQAWADHSKHSNRTSQRSDKRPIAAQA